MSGPKTADYSVVENLALLAAARAKAWEAAHGIEGRLNALVRRARQVSEEYGVASRVTGDIPSLPDTSANTATIERFVSAARAAHSRIEAQLERAIIGRQIEAMLSAVAVGVSGKITSAAAALSSRSPIAHTPKAEIEVEIAARTDNIKRALQRLESGIPTADREAIHEIASEALGATEKIRSENLAVELQYRIQRANETARDCQNKAARAAELLVSLRGFECGEVDEIRRELQRAEKGEVELQPSIEVRVALVSERARQRADRRYAGQVIREEFERLGYAVEEGFETIFAGGGTINLRKLGAKEYGARMRVGAAQGRLDFDVVRFGNKGDPVSQERRLRDKEAEDQWCGDLSNVMAAMKERSVQSRITHRIASGTGPAEAIDASGEGADHWQDEDDRLVSRQASTR